MPPEPALVARTRRLDADIDLLAVAGDDGWLMERGRRGLAGRGTARRVELPGADPAGAAAALDAAMAQIAVDDEVGLPGCGPVAFGALAFDPTASRSVIVPELVVGRAEDGTRWITTIGAADLPAPEAAALVASLDHDPPTEVDADPGELVVRAGRPSADWCAAVAVARDRIRAGALAKVVLARDVEVRAERPFRRSVLLHRLRAAYPAAYLTSVDGVVGASPELLLSRQGDIVRSHPMAGTAARSPDPRTDARLAASLLASTKDREEHQITIDMVHDTLLPWCSYLDAEAEPAVVAMANVQHLATLLEGRLSAPAASAIELVTALHPTPAVCGSPRDLALDVIAELEGIDRGAYAGPVGWVDARGNGEWAVGVRSAHVDGCVARVFAGVGVVADSDPDAELAETRAKLQALLGALLRP